MLEARSQMFPAEADRIRPEAHGASSVHFISVGETSVH